MQCQVIALPAFYDDITGPTEFIIFIINSVKIVNMPKAWVPIRGGGKESRYIITILTANFDKLILKWEYLTDFF